MWSYDPVCGLTTDAAVELIQCLNKFIDLVRDDKSSVLRQKLLDVKDVIRTKVCPRFIRQFNNRLNMLNNERTRVNNNMRNPDLFMFAEVRSVMENKMKQINEESDNIKMMIVRFNDLLGADDIYPSINAETKDVKTVSDSTKVEQSTTSTESVQTTTDAGSCGDKTLTKTDKQSKDGCSVKQNDKDGSFTVKINDSVGHVSRHCESNASGTSSGFTINVSGNDGADVNKVVEKCASLATEQAETNVASQQPQERPSIECVMAVPRYADETYTSQIHLVNHVVSPLRPDWDILKLVDVYTTLMRADMLLMRFPPKSGIPRHLLDKYMPGFVDEPAPYKSHIYGIIMDRVMHAVTSDPVYKMLY